MFKRMDYVRIRTGKDDSREETFLEKANFYYYYFAIISIYF